MSTRSPEPTPLGLDALWRIEAPRIIGALAKMVRDVGLAEDLAQEALVAAIERWPDSGMPGNPGAWLMTTARRRAIDRLRHRAMVRGKEGAVVHAIETEADADAALARLEAAMDDDIGDERLALIFTACHPVLGPEARIALTLRVMGGLTPAEIARAFLTSEAAVEQRLVRARKALREADVGFAVPHGPERAARLDAVLAVIYLIFTEGHAATGGADWMREPLMDEALRLARIVAGLMPHEAEVLGLVALLELTAARSPSRVGTDGAAVPLEEQDRLRWDRLLIRRGLAALERAEALAAPKGPYRLQAEIAACHARALDAAQTDWVRIAALYEALMRVQPGPVVALGHAVAHGRAFGAAVGLRLADEVASEGRLAAYAPLPGVRAMFLEELGRPAEAAQAYGLAARLSANLREKAHFESRAARLAGNTR